MSHNIPVPPGPQPRSAAAGSLMGAVVFLGAYLAQSPASSQFANGPLPLPDAPLAETYAYAVDNGLAAAVGAICHLVSMIGLVVFILCSRRVLQWRTGVHLGSFYGVGLLAVATLTVSAGVSLVVAGTAADLTPETVGILRQVGFIAGGVAHVVPLGVFAFLTSRIYPSRAVRIAGVVMAVLAVCSVSSLFIYYGNMFLPVGRVGCMLWTVVAAAYLVGATARSRSAVGAASAV